MNAHDFTDLGELRAAWQQLGRALERQNDLALRHLRDAKLARARASLLPLRRGQAAQVAFGVLCMLLGASAWHRHPMPVRCSFRGSPCIFTASR